MGQLYGVKGAAARLYVSRERLLELVMAGLLRGVKVGHTWIFTEEEIERVLKLPHLPDRRRKRGPKKIRRLKPYKPETEEKE